MSGGQGLVLRNPFATRFTRPGALSFEFPALESPGRDGAAQLVETLRQHAWLGQITGAHGTGKSTLLHALCPALERAGRKPAMCTLHAGDRRLPRAARTLLRDASPDAVLVIDGYEQLMWWTRWRMCRRCRRAGCGLLVTCHRDCGLPTLFRTCPSLSTVQLLVARLQQEVPSLVTQDDVALCFSACRGNVRETFFALYDLYESRRGQREQHGPSDEGR